MEMQVSENRLMVAVTNFEEFNALLLQAKEEAEQLKRTLNRLSCFDVEFEFSVKCGNHARDMVSASSASNDIPTK